MYFSPYCNIIFFPLFLFIIKEENNFKYFVTFIFIIDLLIRQYLIKPKRKGLNILERVIEFLLTFFPTKKRGTKSGNLFENICPVQYPIGSLEISNFSGKNYGSKIGFNIHA